MICGICLESFSNTEALRQHHMVAHNTLFFPDTLPPKKKNTNKEIVRQLKLVVDKLANIELLLGGKFDKGPHR